MSRLVTIVGNSGSGKTLLTQKLCAAGAFPSGLEQHAGRPFQSLFMQDLQRYAFPNQVDYLLLRAEQEYSVRQSTGPAVVQDGGLDLDYHLYTRYFHRIGYLSEETFDLCRRLYVLLRGLLPAPDLIIYLDTPLDVLAQRRAQRSRTLDITRSEDLALMQALLEDWLPNIPTSSLVRIDSAADQDFSASLGSLLARIRAL